MSERPRSDLAARIIAEGSPSPTLAALQREALAGVGAMPHEGALTRRFRLLEGVKRCERPGCENPRGEGTQWLSNVHYGGRHVELVRLCETCGLELSRWLYGDGG